MLSTVGRGLLSLLVPPVCASCREPELSGAAVCPDCRMRLVALPGSRCRRCGAPLPFDAGSCRECRARGLAFTRAWAPYAYEGVGRDLVWALKSRALLDVAEFMAARIAAGAPGPLLAGTLVPAPAHRRRRSSSGFNHAGAIARALACVARLPVRDLLVREAATAAQAGLQRHARIANARDSVRLRKGCRLPERIVLVDDVYTTGATLDACARALRIAGAGEVVAVTFARTVRQ